MKTMAATPTLVSVWTVVLDGATIHEGYEFAAALAVKRKKGGAIVRADQNTSPWEDR